MIERALRQGLPANVEAIEHRILEPDNESREHGFHLLPEMLREIVESSSDIFKCNRFELFDAKNAP